MRLATTVVFLSFFAPPLFSQDSVVTIKPSTARYYLETEDQLVIYKSRDSLNTQLIDNLSKQIDIKDQVIQTFREDSLTYNNLLETKTNEFTYTTSKLQRQRTKLGILVVVELIVIILLL